MLQIDVGYDLDGVLVPDLDAGKEVDLHTLLQARRRLRPLFQPQGNYAIVTGRPMSDSQDTRDWIHEYLHVPPAAIFIASKDTPLNDNESAAFKAHYVQAYGMCMFVESSPSIAMSILQRIGYIGYVAQVVTPQELIERGMYQAQTNPTEPRAISVLSSKGDLMPDRRF